MFFILIISTITLTRALEPAHKVELADDRVRNIVSKYIDKIPDLEDQYVMDERLMRVISQYFKGKISPFPLFKISLKIDRNPVKIPWTLRSQEPEKGKNKTTVKKTQENEPAENQSTHENENANVQNHNAQKNEKVKNQSIQENEHNGQKVYQTENPIGTEDISTKVSDKSNERKDMAPTMVPGKDNESIATDATESLVTVTTGINTT